MDDYESFYSVNPLHLRINYASGYIEEQNGNKNKIKAINGSEENDYRKDYIKIKFNSDDDFPLNKPLNFHAMTIIIRSVFEEDCRLYPHFFLGVLLYELV